jgi:hypothetical protein
MICLHLKPRRPRRIENLKEKHLETCTLACGITQEGFYNFIIYYFLYNI